MTSPSISPAAVHMSQADFESELLSICGDVRLLWMPLSTDTTTSTSKDRNERTVTYSKDINTFDDPGARRLGNGYYVTFDGTDEEADTPDVDGLSFGDGAVDEPFSVLALVSLDLNESGDEAIVGKYGGGSGEAEEWRFFLDSGKVSLEVYDASQSARLRPAAAASFTTNTWTLFSGTYDGAGAYPGVKLWQDAALLTGYTDISAGTYIAMENTSEPVTLGSIDNNGSPIHFVDGSLAFVLITAKELTADEQWQTKTLVNEFYNLSL